MKNLILLTLTLNILSLNLNAKAKFLPGIIITAKQDTLRGLINCSDYAKLNKTCVFKANAKSKILKYTPLMLKGFQLISSKRTFVSALNPTSNKSVFMEVVCDGKIRLLSVKDAFFVQKQNDNKIYDLIYSSQELYVDNGYTRQLRIVENKQFIETLKFIMNDKENLFNEIEKLNKPEIKSLTRIVNLYNSKQSITNFPTEKRQLLSTEKLTLLRKGKISLYSNPNNENSFYIQKQGNLLSEITFNQNEDLNYNGVLIHSYANTSDYHKDTLMKYMGDAKLLIPSINFIKKPDKKNLEKLVDEYNSYTDDSTYIKKNTIKRLALNIDIIPGIYLPDTKNTNFKAGALLNIGFTKSNKYIFLKTGLFSYKSITENYIKYYTLPVLGYTPTYGDAFKIPLQAEFRINAKYIQPFIAAGYNIYLINDKGNRNQYYFPTIAPGINFNAGERFALHLNLDWEFHKNKGTELFPEYFSSLYLFSGIKINL